MDRAREQSWLTTAVAIAAHAGLLALMVVERARHGDGASNDVAAVVPKAPVALPKHIVLPDPAEPPLVDLDALGEKTGTGNSIKSVDLPDEMTSPKPSKLEQAWTRREPTFAPPPQPPAQQSPAEASAQATRAEQKTIDEESVRASRPLASVLESLPFGTVPTPPKGERPSADAKEVKAETNDAKATNEKRVGPQRAEPRAETAAKNEQRQTPAQPSPPVESNPAPKAESDLDPFAKDEGIDFTPGGVKARQGREVKLVRPRIDLGFMADATRLRGSDIVVKLEISTDGAGKPRLVDVKQSSGSEVIDNAVRVAAYDSWFGGRMPDEFPFTVRFVTE